MPQFFVPRKNLRGTFFIFPLSESQHLAKVLRKRKGDIIQIFDGEGLVASAQITDISDPNAVKAKLIPASSSHSQFGKAKSSSFQERAVIHLYPSLIRSERFEWMLEKVTELGVSSIHPVFTVRTIVHISPSHIDAKIKRWQKIILSAAKQCGRESLPQMVPPLDFNDAIRQCKNDAINLILWEGEEKNTLSHFLPDAEARGSRCFSSEGISVSIGLKRRLLTQSPNRPIAQSPININLFVGPEGGFTIEEVECAKKAGFQSVRLGENILRAETASIAAVSLGTLK